MEWLRVAMSTSPAGIVNPRPRRTNNQPNDQSNYHFYIEANCQYCSIYQYVSNIDTFTDSRHVHC